MARSKQLHWDIITCDEEDIFGLGQSHVIGKRDAKYRSYSGSKQHHIQAAMHSPQAPASELVLARSSSLASPPASQPVQQPEPAGRAAPVGALGGVNFDG